MRGVFGKLRVRLDPWQPEFGPEFGVDSGTAEGAESVDTAVECVPGEWAPVPASVAAPGEVWFVDGVRRLEARVTARDGERHSFGAFGSWAAGAVRLGRGAAEFDRFVTGRHLALSSTTQPEGEIAVGPDLVYAPLRVADVEPEASVRAIHGEMRKAEEALARDLAAVAGRLVVVDGPLTFEEGTRGMAVGYIKRVMKTYLGGKELGVVAALGEGERTPLFALRGSERFSRISWFLRLSAPARGDSEFSGVVRLEVAESAGVEGAKALAEACAALLPGLRARRALDTRAPQNLLPIAALERFLRRKLGDERVIRRRLETFLAREAQ